MDDLIPLREYERIKSILSKEIFGTTTTATTLNGKEVEVCFSIDGTLNIKFIKKASFS